MSQLLKRFELCEIGCHVSWSTTRDIHLTNTPTVQRWQVPTEAYFWHYCACAWNMHERLFKNGLSHVNYEFPFFLKTNVYCPKRYSDKLMSLKKDNKILRHFCPLKTYILMKMESDGVSELNRFTFYSSFIFLVSNCKRGNHTPQTA